MEGPLPQPLGSDPSSTGEEELDSLRELLIGREKAQITHLHRRLEDPELRATDVGRVLARAVRLSSTENGDLSRELSPVVEKCLTDSVRRRPEVVTGALFPIIGAAIRRAVAEAFERLARTIDRAMERSFSIQGLQWRWEAWRSGRRYADIVLYHTLVYRVDQVLLIQRPSGLLLQQAMRPDVVSPDGDVVSGLLTAIHDFVVDSFREEASGGLLALEVGGLLVWVESGPRASLAAVIRGHPPVTLRQTLQRALERIHRDDSAFLSAPPDSSAPSPGAGALLSDCLTDEYRQRPAPRFSGTRLVLAGLVLLAVLSGVQGMRVWRENRRWSTYLDRLAAEEGLLICSSSKRAGRFQVTGLRDPLATDPVSLLSEFGFESNQVVGRWEPYEAIGPRWTLRRAIEVIRPPASVVLSCEDGVLRAQGTAPGGWADSVRRRAEALRGIRQFDASGVLDEDQAGLEEALRRMASEPLFFDETTRIAPGQEAAIEGVVSKWRLLSAAAARAGLKVRLALTGHTDRSGTADYNRKLSRQRAEEARRILEAHGIPGASMDVAGVGSSQPLRPDLAPAEEALNRRVTIRGVLTASRSAEAP